MARQVPDAPKVPTPARDARVEKIAEAKRHELFAPKASCRPIAEGAIRTCEAGGMLVLDPSDPALVERIAESLYGQDAKESEPRKVRPWGDLGPDYAWVKDQYRPSARAVLAALSLPGGTE